MKSILEEADEIVSNDRQNDYGHPYDNFKQIADLWSPILGVEITPEKAAMCMIQVKISRQLHKKKRDNLTDIAGYAKVIDMINNYTEPKAFINNQIEISPKLPDYIKRNNNGNKKQYIDIKRKNK